MNPGRAIRPFPTRELIFKLGTVQLRVNTLQEELMRAMTENQWEITPWRQSLTLLMDVLDGVAEASIDARAVCSQLYDQAERDHEAAQRAALALLHDRPQLQVIKGEKAA